MEKIYQKGIKTCSFFIKPPSIEALQERLTKRGSETAEVIARRIGIAQKELQDVQTSQAVTKTLVNDNFDDFYAESIQYLKTVYPNHIC